MKTPRNPSRRSLIAGAAAATGALAFGVQGAANAASQQRVSPANKSTRMTSQTITTKDGTQIYYKDWGDGPVVTFSHGWPLNADAWDGQMHFLARHGFRVIAHDRRGHGRSTQSSSNNDMNGYADDLAQLIETLDLKKIAMVGHSTGGGEVARYLGRRCPCGGTGWSALPGGGGWWRATSAATARSAWQRPCSSRLCRRSC